MASLIKKLLIGKPMETHRLSNEKLPKWKALPVFSSDALSSVAYATEEVLLALILVGTGLLHFTLPIAGAIIILLIIVTLSYRQIIHAFPNGGGAYVVARDHINEKTSLVAGASLMIDYILTVAVSISSGVAALTSAFPHLLDYKIQMAVAFIIILMILNLRGITESATIFAFPTYIFMGLVLVLVLVGGFKLFTGGWQGYDAQNYAEAGKTISWYSIFLILRAFSGGCSAMTGVEAISNGVPSFREKSAKNAVITLLWMSALLAIMFAGITVLTAGFGILPDEIHHKTVISQIATNVFGNGVFFYVFQIFTMLILFFAANTAFAGFPQLTSILARDGFLPRSLGARGDRLVFSNGILVLSGMAMILVIIFKGSTHALIPLYAVGVFLSFTIGQIGLFRKILHSNEKKKTFRLLTTGLGTFITGTVSIVTLVAKFEHGAWLICIAIPLFVITFLKIHKHYVSLGKQLKITETATATAPKSSKVVIPISGVSKTVDHSIAYAKTISNDITAFSIVFDEDGEKEIREKFQKWYPDVHLHVMYSQYRTIIGPTINYLKQLEKENPDKFITVLVPQFIVKKWWHALLHNQTAIFMRFFMILRQDIVIATLPFHLKE